MNRGKNEYKNTSLTEKRELREVSPNTKLGMILLFLSENPYTYISHRVVSRKIYGSEDEKALESAMSMLRFLARISKEKYLYMKVDGKTIVGKIVNAKRRGYAFFPIEYFKNLEKNRWS